ncbi:LysM peptidoglycan-binding domain-containing protein [Pontibacillus sp. HMF3514]|uniref:LysM peptidoglycan-binding domain-containing protein n=1 Tax=Pontibacillus sp. HMF3514 TaxID=2692425 RepID=UPI00131FDCBB|nr:LysM peptidoglycan-binding domain-containing protein [Pontibacillus sp. HMF3514]QHE52551.1 LysM peptidoglycan-binding domain-containing protein [Pontibacillus sp. HMF3514]
MSNSSEQFEDQAQVLRQRMHHTNEEGMAEKVDDYKYYESNDEDLDVLNLPPRSETHKDKKTGYKWKVRYPVIRLLIVLFIILTLLIPIYNLWGKQDESGGVLGSVQSAKASDASYMLELTRYKKSPETVLGLDNKEETEPSEKALDESAGNNETSNKDDVASTKDGVTPTYKEYVVREGDTLFSISMKFYKSKDGEKRIIRANHLEAEEIYVGQTLLIPQ